MLPAIGWILGEHVTGREAAEDTLPHPALPCVSDGCGSYQFGPGIEADQGKRWGAGTWNSSCHTHLRAVAICSDGFKVAAAGVLSTLSSEEIDSVRFIFIPPN